MASKLSRSIYTLLSLIVFIVQYTDNIKEVVVKDSLHGGRRSDELCMYSFSFTLLLTIIFYFSFNFNRFAVYIIMDFLLYLRLYVSMALLISCSQIKGTHCE